MKQTDDLTTLDLNSLWHPMRQHKGIHADPPRQFVSGDGVYLTDRDGRRVLDGVAGIWCVNVGYGREELADVAREQMARLPYLPGTFTHEPAAALAGKLTQMLGYASRVYFTNSGSEANEAAFKVARQFHAQTGEPGRYKIIARYRGYHGNTLGALSATGQAERKLGYGPPAPGFLHIDAPDPYRISHDCADQLERVIEHFGNAEDTLLLEAAYFLIGNMEGHSYVTYIFESDQGKQTEIDVMNSIAFPISSMTLF